MEKKATFEKPKKAFQNMKSWYNHHLLSYSDGVLFNGRLMSEFKGKYPGRDGTNVHKYDLISNARRTYDGYLSRLNVDKPIVSSYGKKIGQPKIDKLSNYARYVFNMSSNKSAVSDIMSESQLCGVSFGEVYIKEIIQKEYKPVISEGESINIGKNSTSKEPFIRYLSVFDVIFDITGNNRFIGTIKRMPLADIKAEYGDKIVSKFKKEDSVGKIANFDYNHIKASELLNAKCKAELRGLTPESVFGLFSSQKDTEFGELYEVVDRYERNDRGEYLQSTYINGVEVYNGKQRIEYDGFPVVPLFFDKRPGYSFPVGIATLMRNDQEAIDKLNIGYKIGQETIAYPDFMNTGTSNKQGNNNVIYSGLSVKPVQSMNNFDRIRYYDANELQLIANNIEAIRNKAYQNLLLFSFNFGSDGKQIRVAEDARERAKARENKISKYIDNIGMFMGELLKRVIAIKMTNQGIIDIGSTQIRPVDLFLEFELTFDGEDILGLKESIVSDMLNKLNLIAPFNVNQTTGEQFIDTRTVADKLFPELGFDDFVPNNEERLAKYKEDLEYLKQKQAESPQQQPDALDKINLNITFKDLPQEVQYQLLLEKGIISKMPEQMQPPEAPQETTEPAQPMPDVPQQDLEMLGEMLGTGLPSIDTNLWP